MPGAFSTRRLLRHVWVVAAAAVTLSAGIAPQVRAELPETRIENLDLGFGGYYKVGCWTPLAATITVPEPMTVRVAVTAPDPEGSPVTFPSEPIELDRAGEHRLQTEFLMGRLEGMLRVEVLNGEHAVVQRSLRVTAAAGGENPHRLRHSQFIVAAVGTAADFPYHATDPETSESTVRDAVVFVHYPSINALPTGRQVLDGLDAIFVAESYELDADHNGQLRDWVHSGGHLVLAVGRGGDQYRAAALSQWVPVPLSEKADVVRELSSLEGYSGSSARMFFRGRAAATVIAAERFSGTVLAPGLTSPLLVRTPAGLGRVTFLAIDVNQVPLSAWEGLPDLVLKMIDAPEDSEQKRASGSGSLARSGITDLATQLHAAQEDFPQIGRPSSWLVMGLVALYVLVIGPLDYFIVHRVLRRPQLTWVTFPAAVISMTALTAWGAVSQNGAVARLNQLDLMDVDGAANTVRGRTWLTLYSPQTARYQLELVPRETETGSGGEGNTAGEPVLSWSAVPEEGFGGMYRSAGIEFGRPGYRFAPSQRRIENLPMQIWSTRSLAAQWSAAESRQEPWVESRLNSVGIGDLRGEIVHHLPGSISDWVIAYGNRVYRASSPRGEEGSAVRLEPGRPFPIDRYNVTPRVLKGYLTGARQRIIQRTGPTRDTEMIMEQTRYDPRLRDAGYVLQMLTFYRAADGASYTRLDNNPLRSLDLSPLLQLNRAILFGRLDSPLTEARLNEDSVAADRHTTFVRCVLPVTRAETGSSRQKLLPLDDDRDSRPN